MQINLHTIIYNFFNLKKMFPLSHQFKNNSIIGLPRGNTTNCFINDLLRTFPELHDILLHCPILAKQDIQPMRFGMANAGIVKNFVWKMTSVTRKNTTAAVGEL